MKKSGLIVATVASLVLAAVIFFTWQRGQPRREALGAVSHFSKALEDPNGTALLDSVLMPAAIQSRTPAEQTEFLVKALADEISPEGVEALKRHAEFGPAKSIFPADYAAWCQQAGVDAANCVAFKMERNGLRAEVILVKEGSVFRIVRCNNVKQMGGI